MAQRKPEKDEEKHKEEVATLVVLFRRLIESMREEDGELENLEALMEARADFAIRHALKGFGLSYDEAIKLIRNEEDLTDELRVQRDIVIAAVDNLVDFAVAEEYQMTNDLPDIEELSESGMSEDEILEALEAVFGKYNDRYAMVENMDIEYAMIVAAYLSALKDQTILTYMTMGDDRVRPWHLQYEGFTAPKSSFPEWLIPPIEHGCRCFLVEDSAGNMSSNVMASSSEIPVRPDWFNPTFKESVAKGGRIFSDEHPYFQIDEKHLKKLTKIAKRIKHKYLNGKD